MAGKYKHFATYIKKQAEQVAHIALKMTWENRTEELA